MGMMMVAELVAALKQKVCGAGPDAVKVVVRRWGMGVGRGVKEAGRIAAKVTQANTPPVNHGSTLRPLSASRPLHSQDLSPAPSQRCP